MLGLRKLDPPLAKAVANLAPDNYPDGQTTMIYKGGVVLPEITVTPTQRYIDNPYDQFKIYLKK